MAYAACIAVLAGVCGCSDRKGPSPPNSPGQEHSTFRLVQGLRIELVASEPMIEDPVAMTFDEDGRLWVVEMRGFMMDIDRNGVEQPVGRISVLIDTDGDGLMDSATVFLDSLVLPRAVAIVSGGVLVAENKPLWFVQDTDGDLRADVKTLIDPTYGESGAPEHAPNGLLRGLDNWYYNAKSKYRYRFVNGEWIKDETEFRGQWGISHDDVGRLYYNYNWSQLHADLVPPNYLARNPHHTPTSGIDHGLTLDRRVFPVRPTPAVNRGYIPGTLDEDQKLLEFTAACSPLVYRGKALPEEFYGNAFVCEPAGNLIKRNIVEENGFLLSAHAAYRGMEFLASTDERFRPVALASGPDGALYVADMYRGLIEDGLYMTEYLREQTLERKLALPVHMGRIWRIVPDHWTAPQQFEMSSLPSGKLPDYLENADGWYRDMAERLLVERNDPTVVPVLEEMVLRGKTSVARIHALWALDGMNKTTSAILFRALDDPAPHVRGTALRLLESLAKADPPVKQQLANTINGKLDNAEPEFALQIALSASCLDASDAIAILATTITRFGDHAVIRDAVMSSLTDHEFRLFNVLTTDPEWNEESQTKAIFLEMLAASVMRKGDPNETSSMLAYLPGVSSWQAQAIRSGLSAQAVAHRKDPIRLSHEPDLFKKERGVMNIQITRLAQAFTWPGKKPPESSEQDLATLDSAALLQFAVGRQHFLTVCASCHGADGAGLRRFAPPLNGSEWVLGDEQKLTLILLHGMEGPVEVKGVPYDIPDILPEMPSHSVMDDRAIAAILTYIRNAWDNHASPVTGRAVGRLRVVSQGKIVPWTAEELARYKPTAQEN